MIRFAAADSKISDSQVPNQLAFTVAEPMWLRVDIVVNNDDWEVVMNTLNLTTCTFLLRLTRCKDIIVNKDNAFECYQFLNLLLLNV